MSRVTISIPSTESIVSEKKTHTVYIVECSESGYFWTVKRRYSEFAKLQTAIKKQFPNLPTSEFPSKAISSLRDDVIEQRRVLFENYLAGLGSNPEVSASETLRTFLSPTDHSDQVASDSSSSYRFSAVAGSNPGFRIAIIGSKLLSAQGQSKYTSYTIRCENNGHTWTISRRFSQFDELRSQLTNNISKKIAKFTFPAKKLFGNNTSSELVKNRMILFNKFLQECLADPEIAFSPDFLSFLNPKTNPAAESLTDSSHVGYLNKLGHVRKNWKKRWFILYEKNLFYYVNPTDIAPKGCISLEGVLITKTPSEKAKRKFTFELATPSKAFLLQGCNSEDVDNWIFHLTQNKKKYILEPDTQQREDTDHIFTWLPAKSGIGMLGQSGIFTPAAPGLLASQHAQASPGGIMVPPPEITSTTSSTPHIPNNPKPSSGSVSSKNGTKNDRRPAGIGKRKKTKTPQNRLTDSQIVDEFLDKLVLVVDDEEIDFNDIPNIDVESEDSTTATATT